MPNGQHKTTKNQCFVKMLRKVESSYLFVPGWQLSFILIENEYAHSLV